MLPKGCSVRSAFFIGQSCLVEPDRGLGFEASGSSPPTALQAPYSFRLKEAHAPP